MHERGDLQASRTPRLRINNKNIDVKFVKKVLCTLFLRIFFCCNSQKELIKETVHKSGKINVKEQSQNIDPSLGLAQK